MRFLKTNTIFLGVITILIVTVVSVIIANNFNTTSTTNINNSDSVKVEEFGAKGDGKSDDTKAIQNAINKTANMNVSEVILQDNKSYIISSPILIKEGVKFTLGYNTRLQINGDFDAIELEKNASISGGIIEIISSNFNSSVLSLDGKNQFYGIWETTEIHDLKLLNSSGEITGTALSLFASGPSHYISFINFKNITISGFSTGVKLQTKDPGNGDYSWINGNRFENFTLEECENFIVFDGGITVPNESSGNMFTNLQIQLSEKTNEVLNIDGSENKFDGVIWDVQTLAHSNPIIKLTPNTNHNTINFNINSQLIQNEGKANEFSLID
ncbi:glycoside hydrolase family 55 protein [Pseudalkalibacillus hwajinpoensis]|uniref:glycoside hydrolase family 55 protein n=1 Tax=Guptibacillus hwajinpoensis TaxID=208199 RepID=UPI001CD5611C|nr:glycoside hydrolase family 55 protein [Pseudalkalibacillus hwajinpoensis]MCA0991442.1 glycoside hydrolase family 55 protein [Pseudalkalibacillus hwajinpoensis]